MENEIKNMLKQGSETIKKLESLTKNIAGFAGLVAECFKKGNKVLICGDGGSAAQSQHIAAEFVGRYKMERKALPCIALTTDTSILTAWTNDYGFDTVFERQVQALGKKGDVLIGISTSGNSENIIKALKKAKESGIKTVALLGKHGGKTKNIADVELIVPSDDTPRIQEAHITILHIMCELVEKELFSK